jgi:opacity protein-like surface antigen
MECLRKLVQLSTLCTIVLAVASPAMAQDIPRAEVSAGYQLLGSSDETLAKGWYADVSANLGRLFAVVFQVGGNYKSVTETFTIFGITTTATADLKVHEFLAGLRVNARRTPKVTPFGQLLVGGFNGSAKLSVSSTAGQIPFAANDEFSGTNFGLQAGGGLNFELTKTFGIRAGADYIRIFESDAGTNIFRFSAGGVFPF